MSQRSRPGSAQSLADQQRMPFPAAEALLWGKKTAEEHRFIHSRMRELEENHRAYNNRIKATEVVAEAAEAAIARIRRVEQQVAAIESDDRDRPFDKWMEGEVATFKVFMEKNKTIRQKHIELEDKIASLEESVDKAKDVSLDLEILTERIARLENNHIRDSTLIKNLEGEVTNLKITRQINSMNLQKPRPALARKVTPPQMRPPPSAQPVIDFENAADETEDEETALINPSVRSEREQVHIASISKTMLSTSTVVPSSPSKKGRDEMSARLRVMQRKSIHDPKHTPENGLGRMQAPVTSVDSIRTPGRPSLPATQIVERVDGERSKPIVESVSGNTNLHPARKLVVKLNMRKRQVEGGGPIARVTRSQAKKLNDLVNIQPTVPNLNEAVTTAETQVAIEPTTKRRKPNAPRPPPRTRPKAKEIKHSVQATQKLGNATSNVPKVPPRNMGPPIKDTEAAINPDQQPAQVQPATKKKRVPNTSVSTTSKKRNVGPSTYSKTTECSSSRAYKPAKP